jgi:hypothetical protein
MIQIALHIPVWKRLELTRACYEGLKRNIREFEALGYELTPYIAYSEDEHKALAEEYGWIHTYSKNDHLGNKNQRLYEFMKGFEWDWFLQLGSDDFLLPGGAEAICNSMKETEFAGFNHLYFFQRETRKGTYLAGYPCGAGRYMSRRICNKVKLMWNNRDKGCDQFSTGRVYQHTGLRRKHIAGCFIADVKTEVGVTPYFQATPEVFEMDSIIPEAHLI